MMDKGKACGGEGFFFQSLGFYSTFLNCCSKLVSAWPKPKNKTKTSQNEKEKRERGRQR